MTTKKKEKRRKHSDVFKTKLVNQVKGGASYYAVAKKYGVAITLVRNWCIAEGVKTKAKFKKKKNGNGK